MNDLALSTSETMEFLEECATRIVSLGFEIPAIFFLEMSKPVAGILGAAGIASAPLIAPVVGIARYKRLLSILSSREHYESLMRLIENKVEVARAGN